MMLPIQLARKYNTTINKIEEHKKMKYITSIELFAQKKGMEKGKILGQIELLKKFNNMKMLAKDQYNEMMSTLKSQLKELSQTQQNVQTAHA